MTGRLPPRPVLQLVDALLPKLKRRKEDGVEQTRPRHGHAETAVHLALEKVDLDGLDFLSFGVEQRISLVDALGRVDGVYNVSGRLIVVSWGGLHVQINDHDTMPQRPPAIKTGSVLDCVASPAKVVKSCLLLS